MTASDPPAGTRPPSRPARLEAHRDGALVSRFELAEGSPAVLGRSGADWSVPDEPHLSRRHASLSLERGRVLVKRLESAANPVFIEGRERDLFHLSPGEHFVIGRTKFLFAGRVAPEEVLSGPVSSLTLEQSELYAIDTGSRLKLQDLLELPEILRTKDEGEFYFHLASLLRMATGGLWAKVVTPDGRVLGQESEKDQPIPDPSRSLIERSLRESPRPTLYRRAQPQDGEATLREGVDWVLCAAAEVPGGTPLVFYVAGSESLRPPPSPQDARLVGLVADMAGRSLAVRRMEARTGRLRRFFSDRVASRILEGADAKDLEPRLATSTVMFFDIRGFSRATEGKNEKILEHLADLRSALTAMTEEIFKEDGVVLQYMGDGILACWNVPIPDPGHVDRAARAALAMADRLGQATGGWRCGIGLHTGEVVAGAMGSEQVFFYGLMGKVVNQASRIEGITKSLEVPILASAEVAAKVSPEVAACVRVGRFQPAGMDSALDLYELVRAPGEARRAEVFSRGLAALEAGRWEEAYEVLAGLPVQDRAARYLMFLAEHYRRHPPHAWKGVIEFTEK